MKKNTLFLILVIFFAVQGKAQLATLNGQKVLASMKEFAKIDTMVMKETASYMTEFNAKKAKLNALSVAADSLFKISKDAANTVKAINEYKTAESDLKSYSDKANKKIADYRELLTKPYTEKVLAAIKAVATRGKYMQVIDVTVVNILYVNPLGDITNQVINELKAR